MIRRQWIKPDVYAQRCAKRGERWRDAMESARLPDTDQGLLWFDREHEGYIAAQGLTAAKPAPHGPTEEQVQLAMAHAAVCADCDRVKRKDGAPSIRLMLKGRPIYRVGCIDCGCGGLSLISGTCPAGKWQPVGTR